MGDKRKFKGRQNKTGRPNREVGGLILDIKNWGDLPVEMKHVYWQYHDAIIPAGAKIYAEKKRLHRLDGPAVSYYPYGNMEVEEWWTFGLPHRMDGPAVLTRGATPIGTYFVHGIQLEPAIFERLSKKNPVEVAHEILVIKSLMWRQPCLLLINDHIYRVLLNHGVSRQAVDTMLNLQTMI